MSETASLSTPLISPEAGPDGDYVAHLAKNESLWLTVANASLHINRTDEGIVVDIWPKGRENDDPVASTYAFDSELDLPTED
jgi:hypothetical protein